MNEKVVIWGASGHALVVADALRLQGKLSIVGFLDDDPARRGQAFGSSKVLGGREMLGDIFANGVRRIHVAIGHCSVRLRLAELAAEHGFVLETVAHPRAIVAADATLGDGTFLAAGAIVNSGARVANNVILNTGCSVDHECLIDDGAHVGPGAHLGGVAHVGRAAWIGIGAILLDRVRVGERTIIGGGAVVVRDVPAGVVAYGVPARVVRQRAEDE